MRLTHWNGKKYVLPQGGGSFRKIADRLAAYENTLLEPEEVEDLMSKPQPLRVRDLLKNEHFSINANCVEVYLWKENNENDNSCGEYPWYEDKDRLNICDALDMYIREISISGGHILISAAPETASASASLLARRWGIHEVDIDALNAIVSANAPLGLFWAEVNDVFLAVSNCNGKAVLRGFKTKNECMEWLIGAAKGEDTSKLPFGRLDFAERKDVI